VAAGRVSEALRSDNLSAAAQDRWRSRGRAEPCVEAFSGNRLEPLLIMVRLLDHRRHDQCRGHFPTGRENSFNQSLEGSLCHVSNACLQVLVPARYLWKRSTKVISKMSEGGDLGPIFLARPMQTFTF
jgi:hypothetical protein